MKNVNRKRHFIKARTERDLERKMHLYADKLDAEIDFDVIYPRPDGSLIAWFYFDVSMQGNKSEKNFTELEKTEAN